jgi:hypothetical protein
MGPIGNARLTATTGLALLALLAVEGSTILALGPMLPVHVFVGLMLIPPVALKLASTGYRFVRYYSGNTAYREQGPPALPLRLIAPLLVATTVTVLASGVALLLAGPSSRNALLPIHKVSFIVWLVFAGAHVLAHVGSVPAALGAPGRALRWLVVGSALAVGVALGAALLYHAQPWEHNTRSQITDHRGFR